MVACVEVSPLDRINNSPDKTLKCGADDESDDFSGDENGSITDDGESGDEDVKNKPNGITDNGDESEDEETGAVAKGK